MTEKIIVGIDFSTLFVRIGICRKIRNECSFQLLDQFPAVVKLDFIGKDHHIDLIYNECDSSNSKNIIYNVKRLIGRKFDDPEIQDFIKNAHYDIVKDPANNILIKVERFNGNEFYKPEQIVSFIFEYCIESIKEKTGKQPDECVLTVPAYFNEKQILAMKSAADLVKLPVIQIIPEQIAASVAFQYENKLERGTALVYDFGSYSLNVSIVKFDGNQFILKGESRDTSIGGDQIDNIIVNEMIERFKKRNYGKDIQKQNPASLNQMKLKSLWNHFVIQLIWMKQSIVINLNSFVMI